jgi:deaminated glutathione amidase
MAESLVVAAVQMNSQNEVSANLDVVRARVAEAHKAGAQLVVLPENFAFMGGSDEERRAVAEPIEGGDGPIVRTLRELAREHRLTLVGGGMPEASGDPARPYNACVVVGPDGAVAARYRKIHLFDVEVNDGQVYRESAGVTAGEGAVVVPVGPLKVGLSVCYDLRFPELYRRLVDGGAEVLLVPAAFTLMTGKDHWHVLLRARAIESQAYVVAAAQWGRHPKGRTTYGKSLVVDPWGDVVAQASEGQGVVVARLDPARVADVRANLPSLKHRRL